MTYSSCITELVTILNCIVIVQMAEEKPTFLICPHCGQCFLSTRNVDLLTTWMPVLDPIVYTPCLARAVESSPPGLLLQDFFLGEFNVLPLTVVEVLVETCGNSNSFDCYKSCCYNVVHLHV